MLSASKPIVKVNKSTSLTATSTTRRPSITNKPNTITRIPEDKISQRVTDLERENSQFKCIIDQLRKELDEQKTQILILQNERRARDSDISVEQEDINSNIVIRGIEVQSDAPTESLSTAFSGLCSYLGVQDVPEFIPEAIDVVPSTNKSGKSSRPLKVKFKSVTAKRNFLQIRRSKRDIYPSDIGLTQKSRAPLRINEQLTKSNQELLYQARSLRGNNRFKYIWSNNGQILARREDRSRVTRIRDFVHLDELLQQAGLPISSNNLNDASRTRVSFGSGSSHQKQ